MPDVSTGRLNAASQAMYGLDYAGGLRVATGLNLDPNGICRTLWNKELNACYTELLGNGTFGSGGLLNSHALYMPGVTGAQCATPDNVALDITGDIDIRCEYVCTGNYQFNQLLVAKMHNNVTGQRSYSMGVSALFQLLVFEHSVDGINVLADAVSGNGNVRTTGAYRVTLAVANRTITHYQGPDMDNTVQVAQTVVGGSTSIFSGTEQVTLGGDSGQFNDFFMGRITRAQIRNGINGTIVANPDFRSLAAGTTSFADSAGRTWTLTGNARIV
jgi:hypothetical protein